MTEYVGATPEADWTTAPDGSARGLTCSGARIAITMTAEGAEYEIKSGEPGLDDSGPLDSIEDLRALIADVGDA